MLRPECQRRDQRLLRKTAGAWLPSWLSALHQISKNGVGRTGFEPVTSSVSGNDIYRVRFRFFALNCCPWSILVRSRPLLSAAIVTQLVTHLWTRGQADPLLARSVCAAGQPAAAQVDRRAWPTGSAREFPR